MPQHPTFLAEKRRIALRLRELERENARQLDAFRRAPTRPTVDEVNGLITRMQLRSQDAITRATTRNAEFVSDRMRVHATDARRNVPRLLRAAKDVSPTKIRGTIAALLRGELPSLDPYGLKLRDVSGLKTLASDARRLLISEGFDDARANTLDTLDPDIRYPWETSPMHTLQDVCDDLAAAGPYHPWEWPDTPHAYCGCGPGEPVFD